MFRTFIAVGFLLILSTPVEGLAKDDGVWCKTHYDVWVKKARAGKAFRAGSTHPVPEKDKGWVAKESFGKSLRVPAVWKSRRLGHTEELAGEHVTHLRDADGSLVNSHRPLLQLRNQPVEPARLFDPLKKKVRGLYPAAVHTITREVGENTELCAVLNVSMGHITLVGGEHRPMGRRYDLLHAIVLGKGNGHHRVVVYHLPERDVAGWWPHLSKIIALFR